MSRSRHESRHGIAKWRGGWGGAGGGRGGGRGRAASGGRRAVAAAEALAFGRGGITVVARATGLSRSVIALGMKDLRGAVPSAGPGRVRRPGGGRKKLAVVDPTVCADLERLVDPVTRGD